MIKNNNNKQFYVRILVDDTKEQILWLLWLKIGFTLLLFNHREGVLWQIYIRPVRTKNNIEN